MKKFKKFTAHENQIWNILCQKRFQSLKHLATPLHKKGWAILGFSVNKIPDFNIVNKRLNKLTGWKVSSTGVQYEEDDAWLSSLASKTILVTEYIRDRKNLDYTPLPDIFHDAFGHLPFLADPDYARIANKFGLAYIQAITKKEKKEIAENWWYGLEFSLIYKNGKLKALGTGLISSESELKNALSRKVKKLPYDWQTVGKLERSAHKFHKTLFVLRDLKQLEEAIDKKLHSQRF